MRIAFAAYAVSPLRGSESGNSWRVADELASRGHEVHLVTTVAYQDEWPQPLPVGLHIHLVHPKVAPPFRRGLVGVYVRYRSYLRLCSEEVGRLDQIHPFDVVHHYSWGSLFWGHRLWRVGRPTVFGPIGGGSHSPDELIGLYEPAERRRESQRWLITRLAVRLPMIRRPLLKSLTLAANSDTARLLERNGVAPGGVMLPEPTPPTLLTEPLPDAHARSPKALVWIGRLMPRKAAELAVMALQYLPDDYTLTIIGDGPTRQRVHALSEGCRVAHRVSFTGAVPWPTVVEHLDAAGVLIFTSIRDTTGAQLLEASARGLPIVGIAHQGVADFVTPAAGVLVPLAPPDVLATTLAEGVRTVCESGLWEQYSQGARRMAEDHGVGPLVDALVGHYNRAIDQPGRRTKWTMN